jgi:hypothetical protein
MRSTLILSSHLCLAIHYSLFLSGLPTEYLYAFASLTCVQHAILLLSPLTDNSNYIWRGVQVMKLLAVQFSPASYCFIPLGSETLLVP